MSFIRCGHYVNSLYVFWMFVNIAMPHLHFIMYYMPHPHIIPASSESAPFGGSSMPDLCSFFKPSPIKATC